MILAKEEAFTLLRKWIDEETPVAALMVLSRFSVTVKVSGFVRYLSGQALHISNESADAEAVSTNCLTAPMYYAKTFHYAEAKDLNLSENERSHITEDVRASILSIQFATGVELSIFER